MRCKDARFGIARPEALAEDARMATNKRIRSQHHPGHRRILLAVAAMLLLPAGETPAAQVQARRGQIVLPTYPWAAVKHPYFRGTDQVNIYPYPMLDFLSRAKTNRVYRTVVIENEYLRITILPELGGKIHEVIDKTTGQPMFYVNHVIKPGLIGQCGAWTSGGVEWNTGPQGHTVGCMQPVACEILAPEKDGSRSVAIGETERIYGTKWTVVVTLRPGRSFIEERIRIYNPTECVRPYYFWNCTAVPNTPGFRFIYPMTLGTDHGSEKFFDWPIDHGKDLTRGTNYQDAASIFAWHCDQDFFGSYDDGADRGVVSYANHQQVPGKKAWTWGQGGFGKMHQMDLTDDDGPYNEVQTGPLLTQGEVGRLDPSEAVEWQEWWYPVHGIGGFTFANKDVAANATQTNGQLRLRLIGTGAWSPVIVGVWKESNRVAQAKCKLDPRQTVNLDLNLSDASEPLEIELQAGHRQIARFRVPLNLPRRQPPEAKPKPESAAELAQAGWQELLFARFAQAESRFRQALDRDPKCAEALTGLACVKLDSDPAVATKEARRAVAIEPDRGQSRFALAVSECRVGAESAALDDAWKASLDPATAIPARALVAKLLLRLGRSAEAIEALAAPGPWQQDSVCRNRLALALLAEEGVGAARKSVTPPTRARIAQAQELALENTRIDPLDWMARSILGRLGLRPNLERAAMPMDTGLRDERGFALLAEYADLRQGVANADLFPQDQNANAHPPTFGPLEWYWFAYSCAKGRTIETDSMFAKVSQDFLNRARRSSAEGVFPYRQEALPVLQWAMAQDSADGKAALLAGHLLFSLGRHAEGRELWKKAAELGAEPVIACRALGMAAKTLDNDLKSARAWLAKAHQADPQDAIVARDLANVLFALADKDGDPTRRILVTEARDEMRTAFAAGRGRSDFVALLARAQNRLGEFAATARMLDQVRVTVWEGAHEMHDLFEEAHLALGRAHLEAGRADQALAEFNRALEYPANLATGKLENAREAHIHYLRGNALFALGQKQAAVEAWTRAADEPPSKEAKQEEARRQATEALRKGAQ